MCHWRPNPKWLLRTWPDLQLQCGWMDALSGPLPTCRYINMPWPVSELPRSIPLFPLLFGTASCCLPQQAPWWRRTLLLLREGSLKYACDKGSLQWRCAAETGRDCIVYALLTAHQAGRGVVCKGWQQVTMWAAVSFCEMMGALTTLLPPTAACLPCVARTGLQVESWLHP